MLNAQGVLHRLSKPSPELLIRDRVKIPNQTFMAENAIQAPQEASPDTQAILQELAKEGHQVDGISDAKPEEKVEPKAPALEEKPLEDKKPDDVVPKPEDDEGKKPEKPEREPKYVPVSKHNEERHKRQEAEERAAAAEKAAEDLRAQLAEKADQSIENDLDARAKRLAEKHDIDVEFAKDLLAESASKTVLPPELLEDLKIAKEFRAQHEQQAREQQQETGFSKEFDAIIKEFPDMADRKEDLKQLAFSEGNIQTSLRRLTLEYRHDNQMDKPGRKTAEAPTQGKKEVGEVIDYANITEEEVQNLSPEKFDELVAWKAKNGKK